MDNLSFDDILADRLCDFLEDRPATLDEILGAVCETYRVDPSNLESVRGQFAAAVFCCLANRLANKPVVMIGKRVALTRWTAERYIALVNRRAKTDDIVRDDLDLACIRVVERVLMRVRQ
jgi:hypothetical protein